ncbi:MAG: thioredoxin family protein [Bacilli bacterium]|nr:thioredoxin family protein [Bacilli bacterium]
MKIIGSNCSNGMKLRKMVERAIESYEGSVEIELEDNNKKVKNIPALMINDNMVSEGKVLTVREITKFMNELVNC